MAAGWRSGAAQDASKYGLIKGVASVTGGVYWLLCLTVVRGGCCGPGSGSLFRSTDLVGGGSRCVKFNLMEEMLM